MNLRKKELVGETELLKQRKFRIKEENVIIDKKFKELEPCLENLLLFKKEKLECMERTEKEKIIYDKKRNDILNFKLNEKKIDLEKQIRKIDLKNIELNILN